MAFDQYGMPTDGYAQAPSQTGKRAPRQQSTYSTPDPFASWGTDTGRAGPVGFKNPGEQEPQEAQYPFLRPVSADIERAASQRGTAGPAQNGNFDRTKFRDALMSSTVRTPADLQAFVAAHPEFSSGVGVNGDVVTLPTGEVIDAVFDESGSSARPSWTGTGANAQGVPDAPAVGSTGNFASPSGVPSVAATTQPAAAAQSMYSPGQLPQTPFSVYKPGQLNAPDLSVYKPGTLNQYQQVNQQPTDTSMNAVLQQVLKAPALSPEVVAQMQAQMKDQALTMQQGAGQDIRQAAASRGMSGSGQSNAQLAALNEAVQGNLLNTYRDINVGAAQRNRQDMLNALGVGNEYLSGQVNRNIAQYGAGLQGQSAQESLNQLGIASQNDATRFGLERALAQENLNQLGVGSENAATQFALQRALEEEGLKQAAAGIGLQGRGQDIQNSQFGQRLGYDYSALAQQLALERERLAQQGNQFGQTLGFNYAGLNNTNNLALLRALGLA